MHGAVTPQRWIFADANGKAKISSCKAWWFFRGEGIHQVCRGPEKTP
jgi:hypothetical protein